MKHLYLETFGCQMNVADSDRMEQLLFQEGFRPTPRREDADVVLINTCAIREKAEQKVFSLFGQLRPIKEENPDVILGLTGCLAQQEQDNLLKKMPFLDFILGPDAIESVPRAVEEAHRSRRPLVHTDFDREKKYSIPTLEGPRRTGPVAYVNIIKGCDKFCSFCVVPNTRGREKSRSPEEILDETRQLIDAGAREIILLGQNVNSYGKVGLDRSCSFHELLHRVAEVEGVERLRFTSSHPMDFTHEVIEAYRDLPALMNHLHLPVQSGSDAVLYRMRRHHTVENYVDLIGELKREVPGVGLTTDIIVGFPGETDEDFEMTLALMQRIGFHNSYMFAYSPRPFTPAAEYEDSVPHEVKQERLQRLIRLQEELAREAGQSFIGHEVEVLVEEKSLREGVDYRGRNPEYWNVLITCPDATLSPGDTVRVKIETASGHALRGSLRRANGTP